MTESLNGVKVFMSLKHPGDAWDYLSSRTTATSTHSPVPIAHEVLMKNLADVDGVVSVLGDRFDAAVFAALPKLKVVANVAVGYDNINVADATEYGVLVLNTPGVLDDTTADLAFGLMLSAARRIPEADRYVREGKWSVWSFDLLLGTDLRGKTLGIIGLGRIGQAMARRALAFGMKIVYSQRNAVPSEIAAELGGARHIGLDQLLVESDFISIHCPLSAATRHLIGEREFGLMKPSCILVNTARGAVIDEKAMTKALIEGRIKAAGLDVFENEPSVTKELLTLDNVVLAPHIGSASVETRSAMARLAVDGLISAFGGELPPNAVNPAVWPKFIERLKAAPAVQQAGH